MLRRHFLSYSLPVAAAGIGLPGVTFAQDKPVILDMAIGEENAPITVVEYASFTCPHCKRFHEDVFGGIKTNYVETGKVRFIQRDVYFDRLGLWAAMLARCGDGSKFFGVSDILFRTQREWTDGDTGADIVQNLLKVGRLAGMNDEDMNACLQDGEMAQALVDVYQENADRDGISNTPSFIINGKPYPNMNYEDFAAVLDGLATN